MEGRINVVGSEGEEVKLLGGGRSDPDIRSGDSGLESSDTNISGAENDITTKIAAADECRNATDPDVIVMFKAKRRQVKIIRLDIARHLYHKAVHKIQPSVVNNNSAILIIPLRHGHPFIVISVSLKILC